MPANGTVQPASAIASNSSSTARQSFGTSSSFTPVNGLAKPKTTSSATTNIAPNTNIPASAPSAPPASNNLPLSARRSEALDLNTVERRNKPLPGWREPSSRTHIAGIKEAPTYRPTEDEWRDPLEYILSISAEGRKYGICKIIPPDSWDPGFAIDTEVIHAILGYF